MKYEIDVCGLKREVPIYPLNENLSIAPFVIFGDVELTVHSAQELVKRMPECDYLIAPEAKAIPLVYEMSKLSGVHYFLARKKAKFYMSGVFEVKVQSITTSGEQTLIVDQADADAMKGKRIVIVDDVISTGESLNAVEKLVEAAGGNIVAKMAILAEGDSFDRTDITVLGKLPLFTPDGKPLE